MPLPRHYERLVLNWLKSVEGEPQSAPCKEFRQFYFGSLLHDSNTFPRQWPHLHFTPGFAAESASVLNFDQQAELVSRAVIHQQLATLDR